MKAAIRLPWLAAGALAIASLSAQAQSVGVGVSVGTGSTGAEVEAGKSAIDRHCVRQTGTRIVSRRDRARRCTGFAGRSYSRDELLSTGRTDMGEALRMLDPSFR